MERRAFLRAATGAIGTAGISNFPLLRAAQNLAKDEQPWNVLFVLMDDLGWHDTAPYGNKFIDTPNFSKFASESVRFTDAYAACPVCSPTRASILTGQYPARLHLTDYIPGWHPWPYARLLTPEFSHYLPDAYRTIPEALHPMGYRSAAIGKWHLGGAGHAPTDYGFDENIGGTAAGQTPSYFGPLQLPGLTLAPGEFLTQRLTREGAKFMKEQSPFPFFLYEAHYTVHVPLEAPNGLIEKYTRRDTGDVDPVYCAMVETGDTSFGELLQALKDSGHEDRTIVILFSDNGGVRYQIRETHPVTNNAPLRAGKGHLYEGGIREPLMVRWPGITKPGAVCNVPVCSTDFFPTFMEILSIPPSATDGVSLTPLLKVGQIASRPLFWHFPHYNPQGGMPSGAVREGNWKLIEFFDDGRLELFNLAEDIGETRNLVDREAARAKQLRELLADWRLSVRASMPVQNPNYDPARQDHFTGQIPPIPPV